MASMYDNDKIPNRCFSDSSKLTNWILDSGVTCHTKPQISYFTPFSLEDRDKHIEVLYRHHATAKQKGQVQIKMCDNNGDNFITKLDNVLLAPDICNMLFLIITLMSLGHTCLFHEGFCTMYFGDKEKNAVTLPHSAQRKHAFLVKIKQMSKSKKIAHRKKFALGLLHHRS